MLAAQRRMQAAPQQGDGAFTTSVDKMTGNQSRRSRDEGSQESAQHPPSFGGALAPVVEVHGRRVRVPRVHDGADTRGEERNVASLGRLRHKWLRNDDGGLLVNNLFSTQKVLPVDSAAVVSVATVDDSDRAA